MAGRSWRAFAEQRQKYEGLHSSRDYRRKKPGPLGGIASFLGKIFGR